MKSYKDKFIAGAMNNGCPEMEAHKIWNKIEAFAGYSFNASHAVAYSIIGYQCQWLKKYYPLEFFTSSLQFAKDDDIPKRISEIRKFEQIKLSPPDINKSRSSFYTDFERNTIYWSLSRISNVGDATLKGIEEERLANGKFFSIEEFVSRTKGKKVNKKVVLHLILSGCFDELYNISHITERAKLIEEYQNIFKEKIEIKYDEFYWFRIQRELSGFGFFDYDKIVYDIDNIPKGDYVVPEQLVEENDQVDVVVAGLLVEVIKRKTKKGEMGKLTIDHNSDLIDVVIWNDKWQFLQETIEANVNNGIIISGKIQYDNYNKKYAIYSTDKTEAIVF
jgi:DNA polymerase-3 subunit alpha